MPAVAKTSQASLLAIARSMLEADAARFSLAAVATAAGIRPPSLHKRFADRETLIAAMRCDGYAELGARLASATAAATSRSPRARLRAIGFATRAFAGEAPQLFALLVGADERPDSPTDRAREIAIAPLLETCAGVVGKRRALDAARTLAAFINGYLLIELAQAFHLGGDLEAGFRYGLERVIDGLIGANAAPPS